MRVIITGTNGTLAPVLARQLSRHHHQVTGWQRQVVSTEVPDAAVEFIREIRPDLFFHLATGRPEWAEHIASICYQDGVKFLFTSSVSVYSSEQSGPFTPDIVPHPTDDYGRYKMECEQRILAVNPDALIARLGWQIGDRPGSNQMVDFLEKRMKAEGRIEASNNWFPACSFMTDTTLSLLELTSDEGKGVYHLDGNPGLNFYHITRNLNHLQGNRWDIYPTSSPVMNNLMQDRRVKVKPITAHFKKLKKER